MQDAKRAFDVFFNRHHQHGDTGRTSGGAVSIRDRREARPWAFASHAGDNPLAHHPEQQLFTLKEALRTAARRQVAAVIQS
jgi:hypothetical protein